jgi:HEAT repeat protein
MKSFIRQGALLALLAAALTGCGDRKTNEAMAKADALEKQQQYEAADEVLVAAERAREAEIRDKAPSNSQAGADDHQIAVDDLTKKVQADPAILKMERRQIPLYLHWGRPDLASAVYADILVGAPDDTSVYPLVKDSDPTVRAGAIRVLGLAGKPSAIPTLTDATKDADQDVRRAAAAALGTIKDPSVVPPLIDALKDSYWFVRSDAASALGSEGDPRAVQPLLDVVADSDSTVESSAENALALLAAHHASPDDFAARLNDPNAHVVNIAVICLALEKDPRAMPLLVKLAASDDPATRLQAIKALGEAGDPAGIPILRDGLTDANVNIRGWSIIGLGKLNDTASVDKLKAIAADSTQPASIVSAANAVINHLTGAPPAGATDGTTPSP